MCIRDMADYERFDRETKAAEQEAEEIRMQAQQLTVAVELSLIHI